MNTLFFGNGLNRLSKCNPSWDKLISKISKQRFDNNIPNTMKYEAIIADCPYRQPDQTLITEDGKRILTEDNTIRFYPTDLLSDDKRQLLSNFGIEIIDNINLSTSFKSRDMQQIKNMSAFL